jgi:hypothetical protein
MRIHVHRGRGFHRVGQRLEGHPAARIARQGPAMHAEVEIVLHAGRGQHRHHHRLEEVVGLVGQRGRLGGMVVAGDHQHAAVLRAAGGVGVAEHVAAAVHARPLAVPHGEHALDARLGRQGHLLAAPHGGGREVFVDARLEDDVVAGQVLPWPSTASGRARPAASPGSPRRKPAVLSRRPGRVRAGSSAGAPAPGSRSGTRARWGWCICRREACCRGVGTESARTGSCSAMVGSSQKSCF